MKSIHSTILADVWILDIVKERVRSVCQPRGLIRKVTTPVAVITTSPLGNISKATRILGSQ